MGKPSSSIDAQKVIMNITEFPTKFDQSRSRRYFLSPKGAKYFFVASLLMAVAFLVSLYDASGSRNPTSTLPFRYNFNDSLDKGVCQKGMEIINADTNGNFDKAGENNDDLLFRTVFFKSKQLIDIVESVPSSSEVGRLAEIIQNRRGLPNYFMQKMTPEKGENYSISNVVFMHHHKAGGTTTKAILNSIHRNLSIPITLISVSNNVQVFDFYESKGGTDERSLFEGGYSFGICDVLHQRPCSYLTVLRDPYERLISSYFYCQQTNQPLCGPVNAKDVSIVTWAIHQGSHLFRQLLMHKDTCKPGPNMTRYVRDYMERTKLVTPYGQANRSKICWFRQKAFLQETLKTDHRRAILSYCLENLHKWFAVIGILEEYDTSLQLFEAVFQLPFKKFYKAPKNTGKVRAKADEEKVKKMRADLRSSHEVKEALHEDLMLYEIAKKIMKVQKEALSSLETDKIP